MEITVKGQADCPFRQDGSCKVGQEPCLDFSGIFNKLPVVPEACPLLVEELVVQVQKWRWRIKS